VTFLCGRFPKQREKRREGTDYIQKLFACWRPFSVARERSGKWTLSENIIIIRRKTTDIKNYLLDTILLWMCFFL
jgi:hypothetical protein